MNKRKRTSVVEPSVKTDEIQQSQKKLKVQNATIPDSIVPEWLRITNNLSRQLSLSNSSKDLLKMVVKDTFDHPDPEKRKSFDCAWKRNDFANNVANALTDDYHDDFIQWLQTESQSSDVKECSETLLKKYPDALENWLLQASQKRSENLMPTKMDLDIGKIFEHAVKKGALKTKFIASNLTKNRKCGECGSETIIHSDAQVRSSDEGAKSFFKCGNPKCGHRW